MNTLILIKLGGSVITDRSSEIPSVNYENLRRLAKEIAEAYCPERMSFIIVHGAGSYGHQIVKRTCIHEGIKTKQQLVDFAETQRLQNELNVIVTKELIKNGLPAMPCQASASAIMKNKKLVVMNIETVKGFLDIGLIPVFYGVPAYDRIQKCSILSGDDIAPFYAKKLGAKKIIHGTDVDGIFTSDPKNNPNAKLIPEITSENKDEVRKCLSGSGNVDVTGGMFKKVSELLDLGIESQIVNALVKENIKRALSGEKIGTLIKA